MSNKLCCLNLEKRLKNNYVDLLTVSVDPNGAYEIDDALSLERTGSGFRLGVHIADVASQVPLGSEFDKVARETVQSNYEPYVPMFPKHVTKEFSLDEDEIRFSRSVFFEIKRDGSVQNMEFVPAIIRLDANLDYNGISKQIASREKPYNKLCLDLINLWRLQMLKGKVAQGFFCDKTSHFASNMIAHYMVMTNNYTAEHLFREGVPVVRRSFYNKGENPVLSLDAYRLFKNNMAFYTLGSHPHQSLMIKDYVHSTSPIRRYADIMVQRQLHAMDCESFGYLSKQSLKKGVSHLNDKIATMRHAA